MVFGAIKYRMTFYSFAFALAANGFKCYVS